MNSETLLRLFLYMFILSMGMLVGYKDLISKKIHRYVGFIQMGCLLFLLFIMGLRIGLDKTVIDNIFHIGGKALVITLASVLFSILFVRIGIILFKIKGEKR